MWLRRNVAIDNDGWAEVLKSALNYEISSAVPWRSWDSTYMQAFELHGIIWAVEAKCKVKTKQSFWMALFHFSF